MNRVQAFIGAFSPLCLGVLTTPRAPELGRNVNIPRCRLTAQIEVTLTGGLVCATFSSLFPTGERGGFAWKANGRPGYTGVHWVAQLRDILGAKYYFD
jgi:hypothetical protein